MRHTTQRSDMHQADILAALKKAGTSLRQVAIKNGYAPHSLGPVFHRSWPKAEKAVAEALGVEPSVIWPSRYQPKRSPAEVLAEHFSAINDTRLYSINTPRKTNNVVNEA